MHFFSQNGPDCEHQASTVHCTHCPNIACFFLESVDEHRIRCFFFRSVSPGVCFLSAAWDLFQYVFRSNSYFIVKNHPSCKITLNVLMSKFWLHLQGTQKILENMIFFGKQTSKYSTTSNTLRMKMVSSVRVQAYLQLVVCIQINSTRFCSFIQLPYFFLNAHKSAINVSYALIHNAHALISFINFGPFPAIFPLCMDIKHCMTVFSKTVFPPHCTAVWFVSFSDKSFQKRHSSPAYVLFVSNHGFCLLIVPMPSPPSPQRCPERGPYDPRGDPQWPPVMGMVRVYGPKHPCEAHRL